MQWQLLGLAAAIIAAVFVAVVLMLAAVAVFYGGREKRP
jgi:heme/copper-type cytochrome/quinol oxidase subunit 2